MKIRTLVPVLAAVASLTLCSCASTKVKSYTDYKLEDIKSVCLEKNLTRKGSTAVETLITQTFDNLGIKHFEVDNQIQANETGCTHYMKYTVKAKKDYVARTRFAFYQVVPNQVKYIRLNNSTLAEKFVNNANNAEAQKAVQGIISDILNNRNTNK